MVNSASPPPGQIIAIPGDHKVARFRINLGWGMSSSCHYYSSSLSNLAGACGVGKGRRCRVRGGTGVGRGRAMTSGAQYFPNVTRPAVHFWVLRYRLNSDSKLEWAIFPTCTRLWRGSPRTMIKLSQL